MAPRRRRRCDAAAGASSPASASLAAPAGASSPASASASLAAPAGSSSPASASPAGRPLRLVYCDDKGTAGSSSLASSNLSPSTARTSPTPRKGTAASSTGTPSASLSTRRLKQMGDSSVEVTEESRDASQEAIGLAIEAISEGKLEEAVEHLTKAILLNPTSAIMYGTRAPRLKPSARVGTEFPGVRWLTSGRYQAHFKDKKDITVGTFDSLEEAVKARDKAMLKVKRPKAKKLKGSKAKKQVDTAELQKVKQMVNVCQLERSKQEAKLKDDSLRKLEEKCQNLQDKVKDLEIMSEKQQHQLSRKLKEKEEACTALEQKIKELELELMLQRVRLLDVKLQEVKLPFTREEAGGGHGHG